MKYFKVRGIMKVYLSELPKMDTNIHDIINSARPAKVLILEVPSLVKDDFYRYQSIAKAAT